MRVKSGLHDGLGNAAVLKNPAEAAAGADQQSDGSRGREAFFGKFQNGFAAETAHAAQDDEAEQRGSEERNVRAADKVERGIGHASRAEDGVGPASDEHEGDGEQHGENRKTEAGQVLLVAFLDEL